VLKLCHTHSFKKINLCLSYVKINQRPLIFSLQCAKQKRYQRDLPCLKLEEDENVTEEIVVSSLRRALDQFSSLQASDGHWPGDFSGIMFIMPGLVRLISAQNGITSFFFSFFPCSIVHLYG
jgi:hypothetical protein